MITAKEARELINAIDNTEKYIEIADAKIRKAAERGETGTILV